MKQAIKKVKPSQNPNRLKPIRINDEHTFQPPDAPEDKSEILYSSLPKKDQYWRRDKDELHRFLGLPDLYFQCTAGTLPFQENTLIDPLTNTVKTLSIDDTLMILDVRDRELQRRQKGIHFFNNGEIEYITGNNYFWLVYYKIPAVGNPGFRKFQRDCFYIIEIALKDPNCLGAYFAKAKKTGLTHIMCSLFLNESTMTAERGFGVMNKSKAEADSVNIAWYKLALNKLPHIMRPVASHTNLSMVSFGEFTIKQTGTKHAIEKQVQAAMNQPLNSMMFSAPTKMPIAFDGPMMYFVHLDEFPKWLISPAKMFSKITETVKLQQTIIGKIWITSYPPEEDGQGFEEGKEIYYNSKLTTIKEGTLGRTASGLICHFVSALDATDGTFDIYGNSDRDEALRRNEAERRMCKTPAQKQEKVRQYCRDEEECWRSGGSGSTFDNNHLSAGQQSLEKREREGEILVVPHDIEWVDGTFDAGKASNVARLIPRTAEEITNDPFLGWFRIAENYSPENYNRCRKDENGDWTPPVDSKFIMTVDPPEYKPASGVKRDPSDASIVVMSFTDFVRNSALGRVASNLPVMLYTGRREDPDDILRDVVKCLFVYSCYVLVEANKGWMVTALVKMGLQNFLLVRLADNRIVPYVMAVEMGLENFPITSTNEVIEAYCREGNSYLRLPVTPDDIDYVMHMRFISLFKGLMRFNPAKTKEFDEVVAFLLCLLAKKSFSVFQEWLKERQRKNQFIADVFTAIVDYA